MKDWIIQYVKTKDIFTKQLKKYDVHKDHVEFDFGTHKHYYVFDPILTKEIIEKSKGFEIKSIVVEKTEENFQFMINNFEELSKISRLIVIFLSKDKSNRILINPKMHAMVADPNSLELGLRAIWEGSN